MNSELFNQEAIQELSSPEQLDKQVKLIGNGTWAIFAAIIVGTAAVILWLFVGNVSSGEEYAGVIFDHNNVLRLNADVDGIIQDTLVKEGDVVAEGDIIAVLSNEELISEIAELNERKKELKKGSPEYKALEMQIMDENSKLILLSSTDGVIQSIGLRESAVKAGECIATVVPGDSYNEVYIYVPKEEAGALEVGMEAQITPSYVTREEYGYMEGMISDISSNLVTENSIIKHMGTMDYVEELIPSKNSVRVTIQLSVASDEDGNYRWSNEKGKSLTIRSGDQCKVRILKQEYHPYELLLAN